MANKKKYCAHESEAKSCGRNVDGTIFCPDCLIVQVNKLNAGFDLRFIPLHGPEVVHIETWKLMNKALETLAPITEEK